MSENYPNLLVWVDLETTGLDSAHDLILEVGILLTDAHLHRLGSRSWVIHQPPEILGGMDVWCLRQHGASGLIAESAASKLDRATVSEEVLAYLGDNMPVPEGHHPVPLGAVPMCGASVHFDRAFLRRWMPHVERWFYYGNLDVSSIEKVARLWYPDLPKWEDRGLHRVDPDNEDAVAELVFYREHLFVPSPVER